MYLARQAMDKIKVPGGLPSYMGIQQGRNEDFGAFLDKGRIKAQAEASQNQVLAALAPLQASAVTSAGPSTSFKCFRCGVKGHLRRNCQAVGVWCQNCRSDNHNTVTCRRRSRNLQPSARKNSGRAPIQAAVPSQRPPAPPHTSLAALSVSTAPPPSASPTSFSAPRRAAPPSSCAAASVQPVYNVVKDADGPKPEDRCDPGPVDPESESDAFSLDTLFGAGMTNFPTAYCDVLEQGRKETILRGDADTLQTFPNQVPHLESLPCEAVKELRESVRTYGVQSAFTYNLLVANSDSCAMTPHDWKTVLRMILSAMQYAVFMIEYRLHNLTDTSLPQIGTHPCGTAPLQLCQTNVTHIPEFGCLKYAHITIDTHSSYVFATAHTGEHSHDTRKHWLSAYAAMGIPHTTKTDNGPAYTSKATQTFLQEGCVKHTTAISHSPTEQAITDHIYQTLKSILIIKQKRGNMGDTLQEILCKVLLVLLVLKFLNRVHTDTAYVDHHFEASPVQRNSLWLCLSIVNRGLD
ncbi:uncharacterized protein LOC107311219 [Coturnix japonica]|uniref:uncharacterized protein LOC107311219 n=1 Tax=Coturnix japonica TaxID=93934 RepID=UPI000776EF72|nr:uncharacterized protein LOC107311219 [Coturnix japonica]